MGSFFEAMLGLHGPVKLTDLESSIARPGYLGRGKEVYDERAWRGGELFWWRTIN